eukprot:CAMPEP_0168194770 /NCGR_PEP_ID=MMETSP0139_2-20121125/19431_1 /TAXON_ID=44445 /ORGANISM="Pseudo-nitzschia australis, Strain 10249 10 AB" /LENGTH=595 /DNA_ID=CAMNT_0008118443 /DNA_START=173 /DNA_END=1960 /DNA_ORIENTATION=-
MTIPVLSLNITTAASSSTTSRRLLLRSACHLQLYCTATASTSPTTASTSASTTTTASPNFTRGSSLQTTSTIYDGNERRIFHDHAKHPATLRNYCSSRSLAAATPSSSSSSSISSSLHFCKPLFGHDRRRSLSESLPRSLSQLHRYYGNISGQNLNIQLNSVENENDTESTIDIIDGIHLPFFGKQQSKLPASSSSILKQDDDELSTEELRLKKALNDYIRNHQQKQQQQQYRNTTKEETSTTISTSTTYNYDESFEDYDDEKERTRFRLENLQRAYMDLEYWEEALQIEAFKCHVYFAEDTDEYADSIHAQGKFYLRQQSFADSKRLYEEALDYFERTDNSVQQGHVLISLAGWYFFRNQLDEALDCLQRSESVLDSNPNPALLYKCLDNQGLIYRLWGEFHVALDKYQQALQVVLVDDTETRLALKLHVADMHLALDESHEALAVFQELLIELASSATTAESDNNNNNSEQQSVNNLGMRGVLLHNIATIHADLGEHDLALAEFREALAAKQSSAGGESNPEVAKTLNSLGALHAGAFGEKHVALEYFQQALLIARIHADVGDGENPANDPDVANALQNISVIEQELAGKRES